MTVGITGTQNGCTTPQRIKLYAELDRLWLHAHRILHHGDCIGVDEEAATIWAELGGETISHPPIKEVKRAFHKSTKILPPKDYGVRDYDIVYASRHMVCCPGNMTEMMRGSGTWLTIRITRRLRVPHTIIFPTGEVQRVTYD
jgi:hypothetical protein